MWMNDTEEERKSDTMEINIVCIPFALIDHMLPMHKPSFNPQLSLVLE